MRKSTKVAVLVLALVALCSLTAMAKGWVWSDADAEWTYEDSYGERVYLEWKKDTNGLFYFLGDEGLMLRNQLVEDGDNLYYVGEDGAKVVNCWKQIDADDNDADLDVTYRWYYFGSNGKAVRQNAATDKMATQKYNGETYYFDSEGKMLFGYHNGYTIINQDDPFDSQVVYYSGTNEDGAVKKNAWFKIEVVDDQRAYEDVDSYWVYFDKNGKKAIDKADGIKWNGKRFYFDEFGHMLYKWATVSTAEGYPEKYLNGEDEGWAAKREWVYTKDDKDSDDLYWFWIGADGVKAGANSVLKINGKFYAFDKEAKMVAGVVELTDAEASVGDTTAVKAVEDLDKVRLADWIASPSTAYYFFSNDYVNDGSLKKSTTFEVEFFDDTYKLTTDKTGRLVTGELNKKNYINGYLLAADADAKYETVKTIDGWKLVNATGTGVKEDSIVADADGNYYVVKSEAIYKVRWTEDYPSRIATAIKNQQETVTVGKTTYEWKAGTVDTKGVTPITVKKQ